MGKINISGMLKAITRGRASIAPDNALLVAISGIDAAGKTTVSGKLAFSLREEGLEVAMISLEKWHNPRKRPISGPKPAVTYYQEAYKWQPLFEQLLLPLKQTRSVALKNATIEVAPEQFQTQNYEFAAVDVVLVDGVFLLKPQVRAYFDLGFWVEVSFTTALNRALKVKPRGVSISQYMANFQKVYFPAQRLHIERDTPQDVANAVYPND